MRKTMSCLLLMVLLLTCVYILPLQTGAETEGYYEYFVIDGEATIIECNTAISGDITIPSTLGGYPVTAIGEAAFWRCESLVSVTVPASVTAIWDDAFAACDNLVGIWVVEDNPKLSSDGAGVLFDKEKTWIHMAPAGISGSYTVPDSVTGIYMRAFSGCDKLTSVTIGSGVTDIEWWAFDNCANLTGIWVAEDNPQYCNDEAGVLFNKDKTQLIQAPGGISGSYTIADSVATIGDSAFSGCENLETVTIGNNVTSIERDAFDGCWKLAYNIYDNAKYLPTSTNPYYALITKTDWDITDCTIHPDTKLIAGDAFSFCGDLTAVTIPDSVITVDEQAFWSCSSLSTVTIGDGVTTIGESAFSDCGNLKTVIMGDSVTTIGMWAFDEYAELNYTVYGNAKYLPSATNPYYALMVGTDYDIADCTIHPDTKVIAPRAFGNCENLGDMVIPDSVTAIGDYAFYGCKNMTAVTIGNGVTNIGEDAFLRCDRLTAVTMGNSVTVIEDFAFNHCGNLTAVRIPKSLTTVGRLVFFGCNNLADVYYTGTEDQWAEISIGERNECLTDATIHFESEMPDVSDKSGDLDGIEGINEDDAIYLLQYVLMPDLFPVEQNVDFDKNGTVDEDDAIYLLQHVLMPDLFPLG